MIYTIIYSEEAIETFDASSEQINQRWGIKHVLIFEQHTLKAIEIIRKSPLIFQATETNMNVRKAFIHKSCSMFYKVNSTNIEILFFWDNRQDPIFR
jgi:hypothetical protein